VISSEIRVFFIAIAFLFYAHALSAEQVVVCRSVKDLVARSVAERFEKETGIPVRLVPENRQAELSQGFLKEWIKKEK
jgi:hypothetical protein